MRKGAAFGAALGIVLDSSVFGAVCLLELIALLGVLEASQLARWEGSSFFSFQVEILLLKPRS